MDTSATVAGVLLAVPAYWLVSRLALFVVGAAPSRWRSLSAAHGLALVALALPLGWLGVALNGWTWVGTLTILPAAAWWYARDRRAVAPPVPWRLPWYRLPVRVPVWFALAALSGWGVVIWRGAAAGLAPTTQPPTAAVVPRGELHPVNPYR